MLCLLTTYSKGQDADSVILNVEKLPGKYYSKVNKKISSIDEQLTKKSVKYLAKFQRQERKLQEKLKKLNPEVAVENATEKYNELSQKIKTCLPVGMGKTAGVNKIVGGEYNPYMDSLGTSLSFLKQFKGVGDKIKEPLAGFNSLQGKLQQSEKIKEFIAERRNQIKELLSKYTKLPGGLKNQYDKLSKTAWYYSAQVKEYKEMLKDPEKIEKKALALLNKLPAFQKFMKENSQLASLFRIPGSPSSGGGQGEALTGLQTRSSVQSLIQQRIASGGPNAQAQIQQNLAAAQAGLNKLKDKINQLSNGGGSGDPEMPNFKPNSQKTKSFLKRLEHTADMQFGKTNSLLPSTANIGLGLGYKLNDKSIAGIGLSYKMGMGTVQHINITHQGIGLRSYADYKIKGSFYVSGGYEMNYNAAFKNIAQLKNYSAWQRSGLIGASKKYKITKKVKGEMKLLYDLLANEHIPVTQPVVFRIGYKF